MQPAFLQRNAAIRLLLILGILLPPLLCFGLIYRFGVDVPFADDFTLAPLFVAAHEHRLTLSQLLEQHNEHRYLLQRIAVIGFAKLFNGNLRAEMMFSVLLAALSAAVFWHLIRRTIDGSHEKQLGVMLLVSLLLFSPVQAENWMWGFQFALFLNNLLLVSAIAVAVSRLPIAIKFVLCAVLASLATFSFGSGALLWALTFPLALLPNDSRSRGSRIAWALAWALCAAAAVGSYFINYSKPAAHPTAFSSVRVTDYFAYVLAFLGAHLSGAEGIFAAAVLGAGLLVMVGMAVAYILRADVGNDFQRRVMPWLAFAVYAVLNAGLAAVARISFGVSQALDSRYTSFSLYVSIGLVGVCAIVLANKQAARWQSSQAALITALVVLSVGAYSSGIEYMRKTHQTRLRGKAALLFASVPGSGAIIEASLRANQHDATMFAQMLDSIGMLRPRLVTTNHPAQLQVVPADRELSGYVDEVQCSGGSCTARGWAVLPTNGRTPDAVVLSYGTAGDATLFAMTTDMHQRMDVAQLLHEPALLESGWTMHVNRDAVPAAAHAITGWAVDGETGILYELRGSATLP